MVSVLTNLRFHEVTISTEVERMLGARLARTEGSVRLGFVRAEGQTAVASLRQSGAARVRFPKPGDGNDPEAGLLNMAGGPPRGGRPPRGGGGGAPPGAPRPRTAR